MKARIAFHSLLPHTQESCQNLSIKHEFATNLPFPSVQNFRAEFFVILRKSLDEKLPEFIFDKFITVFI